MLALATRLDEVRSEVLKGLICSASIVLMLELLEVEIAKESLVLEEGVDLF